jgi:alkyl hydroperoxide reductase subunit D
MGNVLRQAELTEQQAWGAAVCSAITARNAQVLEALLSEARKHLSNQELYAAKAAAALMGMNNVFYRFRHLSGNEK